MCGFTMQNNEEGIKFSDGTFLPIDQIKLENLTAEQRKELEDMKVINELSIRKKLHEHGNALQNILNSLSTIQKDMMNKKSVETIIDNRFEKHFNDKKMNDYLEKKWSEIFREKVLSTSVLLKALFIIIGSIVGTGVIIEFIKGKL